MRALVLDFLEGGRGRGYAAGDSALLTPACPTARKVPGSEQQFYRQPRALSFLHQHMDFQERYVDHWATASLMTAGRLINPDIFTWSGSESEDEGAFCGVFDGAVSPGFTDEEEELLAARQACPPVPSITLDADWLFDLRRGDKIADEEVQHTESFSREDESSEVTQPDAAADGRPKLFRNSLPPLVRYVEEEQDEEF